MDEARQNISHDIGHDNLLEVPSKARIDTNCRCQGGRRSARSEGLR